MPQKNCDHELKPVNAVPGDDKCPKCGSEMEPIDIGVEGLHLEHLQLCPSCYLVVWSDAEGLHVRQGVPMKKGANPRDESNWLVGEPGEC